MWVFTSMEEVIYVWSETREGYVATDFLANFDGVLVSDFYTAYEFSRLSTAEMLDFT